MSTTHELPAAPVQRILAAARFAAEKHAAQKRKGDAAEPYINHLIEVAELAASSSDVLDPDLVIAAFLHDTVEDVGVTPEEIAKKFGPDVAGLVLELTDDKTLPKQTRKALQVKNAHKKSPRAQTLKLADKISNLRAILSSPPRDWSAERKREYFDWARDVIAGLQSPNHKLKEEFDRTYARFEKNEE
jgi:GTP diphosphokinase / guanosine-3',5'-bis(diphosphate) 3'-diphosphatase